MSTGLRPEHKYPNLHLKPDSLEPELPAEGCAGASDSEDESGESTTTREPQRGKRVALRHSDQPPQSQW